jgi:hypothetical protein
MLSIPTPPRPIIFNPGQASISLQNLSCASTKTTLMLFYLQRSNLFLRYFCCYYFISTFSKAIIPLLEIRRLLHSSFFFIFLDQKFKDSICFFYYVLNDYQLNFKIFKSFYILIFKLLF